MGTVGTVGTVGIYKYEYGMEGKPDGSLPCGRPKRGRERDGNDPLPPARDGLEYLQLVVY